MVRPMRLRVFRAPTMAAAMAKVRQDLGPDALILGDRRMADGVEVTEVVGQDRYDTSAQLLGLARGTGDRGTTGGVTLASGLDHPDALIGGTYGQPVGSRD